MKIREVSEDWNENEWLYAYQKELEKLGFTGKLKEETQNYWYRRYQHQNPRLAAEKFVEHSQRLEQVRIRRWKTMKSRMPQIIQNL